MFILLTLYILIEVLKGDRENIQNVQWGRWRKLFVFEGVSETFYYLTYWPWLPADK